MANQSTAWYKVMATATVDAFFGQTKVRIDLPAGTYLAFLVHGKGQFYITEEQRLIKPKDIAHVQLQVSQNCTRCRCVRFIMLSSPCTGLLCIQLMPQEGLNQYLKERKKRMSAAALSNRKEAGSEHETQVIFNCE